MAGPMIPSYVSEFARAHAVDLSKVTAEDSRQMSLIDVANYAQARGDGDLMAQALASDFHADIL